MHETGNHATPTGTVEIRLRHCQTCNRCVARGSCCELGYKNKRVCFTDLVMPCEPCPKPLTIPEYIRLRKIRQANNQYGPAAGGKGAG